MLVLSPDKIYEIIFVSFCLFPLEHFDFFLMFLLLFAMFDTRFSHIFRTKQNTRQAIGSILPPRIANSWKLLKRNKPKGLLNFWEVKICGWFTHIVYNRTQFTISSQ